MTKLFFFNDELFGKKKKIEKFQFLFQIDPQVQISADAFNEFFAPAVIDFLL